MNNTGTGNKENYEHNIEHEAFISRVGLNISITQIH